MRFLLTMIVALSCVAPLSNAHSAGWTAFRQISEFNQQPVAGGNSELVFVTLEAGSNPSGCSTSTSFYFAVSNDRHKRLFAMLMAAKLAGSSVMLYVTDTCNGIYAQLDGAVIQ